MSQHAHDTKIQCLHINWSSFLGTYACTDNHFWFKRVSLLCKEQSVQNLTFNWQFPKGSMSNCVYSQSPIWPGQAVGGWDCMAPGQRKPPLTGRFEGESVRCMQSPINPTVYALEQEGTCWNAPLGPKGTNHCLSLNPIWLIYPVHASHTFV